MNLLSWFHQLAIGCCRGASLVRLLCVLALIAAQGVHIATDFQTAQGISGQPVIASTQPDQDNDSATLFAEVCHTCSVAEFLAVTPPVRSAVNAPAIPEGVVMRLSVFTNSLTAPPPKA